MFCLAWSPDGKYCVTVCRDGRVRLYNPRLRAEPLQEGAGPDGTRGARVVWVCDGKYFLVAGMNKSSDRNLVLYDPAGLGSSITELKLGTNPSLLIPYFDEDSQTLFLTGRVKRMSFKNIHIVFPIPYHAIFCLIWLAMLLNHETYFLYCQLFQGDSAVLTYEIADEHPYFFPLSNYTAGSIHQALAFLPKRGIDVQNVEFAKALRLTTSRVEPLSFTVPRVKVRMRYLRYLRMR